MAHTIGEAQAVLKKHKETGLALKVGVQAMSDDSFTTDGEAIRTGKLGQVVEAQLEYIRRYNAQAPWRMPDVTDATLQPADLDWNTWLGDAPRVFQTLASSIGKRGIST